MLQERHIVRTGWHFDLKIKTKSNTEVIFYFTPDRLQQELEHTRAHCGFPWEVHESIVALCKPRAYATWLNWQ